jgi:hypothetical protein
LYAAVSDVCQRISVAVLIASPETAHSRIRDRLTLRDHSLR